MTAEHETLTYTDPRFIDGDPFEVADKALAQVEDIAKLLERAAGDAFVMARNAEQERMLYAAPDKVPVIDRPTAVLSRISTFCSRAADTVREIEPVRRAARFNPRHPPKE